MDFLNRVQRGLNRALAPFRDLPSASVAPSPRPAVRAPLATKRGGLVPTLLEAQDFSPGPFRPNEWAPVAYFQIPSGVLQRFPAGVPYRMYVKARLTVAGNNNAGGSRTVVITGLVETQQAKPTLPSVYHPEVVVWCRVGGVWQQATITAVLYAAESVTFYEPANCTDVEIYYVHGVGEWRFRVYRELGVSDTAAVTVANGSFSAAHLVDQNNAETSHKWPRLTVMIPGQRLAFEVNTSREVVFNERAKQMLILHSYTTQIDITDRRRLAQLAELALRQGV